MAQFIDASAAEARAPKRSRQSFAWCFTINNPTDADREAVLALKDFSRYLVCGNEVGEQGTPHLQGYCYLHSKKTMGGIGKLLKRAHLEIAKGDAMANYAYATKDGDVFVLHGTAPTPGCRSDLALATSDGLAGMRMVDVVSDPSCSYQAARMAALRLTYLEEKRSQMPEVVWFWGNTGVGKSYGVMQAYPHPFIPKSFKWWDGYDGQDVVLIDEFRGDWCKFHELLTLLDRLPYRVECKGGMRQLRATKMYITSCSHPAFVYNGRTTEDLNQLFRRIKHVIHVRNDGIDGSTVHWFCDKAGNGLIPNPVVE